MRVIICAAVAASFLLSSPVRAQDPAQIFGLILGEVERHADRARQRKWQRAQRRQHEAQWQSFIALWRACFDQADLSSCDQALAYPNIGHDNTQRLHTQMDALLAAQQSARDEARRRLPDAEAETLRRQREAEQAARRAEEQRLAALRTFAGALEDCRRFTLSACDRASEDTLATAEDRVRIAGWRTIALAFSTDFDACRTGSIAACDRAVLSPAIDADSRRSIAAWRAEASPFHRITTTVSSYVASVGASVASASDAVWALPLSTLITGGLAAVLAGIVAFMLRQRRAPVVPHPQGAAARPPLLHALRTNFFDGLAWLRRQSIHVRLHRLAFRLHVCALAWWRARSHAPSPKVGAAPAAVADRPRDPETAFAALQLARAYLDEFDGRLLDMSNDPIAIKGVLNTLSLVSQQLAIAERADPSAVLSIVQDDGSQLTHTLADLKAQALFAEGICRATEKPKRAIAILEKAADFDPEHAGIAYVTGLLHFDLMHKSAAIAAFERALALEPDNLEYRKALVRAQSLSGAEIAYQKAAKGVQRGIATARVISLLVQLAPLIFLSISLLTFLLASTPEGKASAFTPFLIGILLAFIFGVVRHARARLSLWVRENSV